MEFKELTYQTAIRGDFGDYKREQFQRWKEYLDCLLYTSPSPRDATLSRMPSSA